MLFQPTKPTSLVQNLRKLKLFVVPNSCLLKSKLSNNVVVYGKNKPGYGGRGVYLYRDAIEPELQIVEQLVDRNGVFIDIGANSGVYSLKMAKQLDKGVVIAVEPVPELLATLQYSANKNQFHNIRLRNLCLGAKTEVRTLWMNHNKPNSFSISDRIGEPSGVSVLTVALDDLAKWEGLERLDYIKVDAEGAEVEILKGGLETITKYRPVIQLETIKIEVEFPLDGYLEFRLPNSPNKVCMPKEHPKRNVLEESGATLLH